MMTRTCLIGDRVSASFRPDDEPDPPKPRAGETTGALCASVVEGARSLVGEAGDCSSGVADVGAEPHAAAMVHERPVSNQKAVCIRMFDVSSAGCAKCAVLRLRENCTLQHGGLPSRPRARYYALRFLRSNRD